MSKPLKPLDFDPSLFSFKNFAYFVNFSSTLHFIEHRYVISAKLLNIVHIEYDVLRFKMKFDWCPDGSEKVKEGI